MVGDGGRGAIELRDLDGERLGIRFGAVIQDADSHLAGGPGKILEGKILIGCPVQAQLERVLIGGCTGALTTRLRRRLLLRKLSQTFPIRRRLVQVVELSERTPTCSNFA